MRFLFNAETNVHLFWQCWYIQDLWSKIQEILTSNNIEIQLSYINRSFGGSFKYKLKIYILTFIVHLLKYYIFPQNKNYKDQI